MNKHDPRETIDDTPSRSNLFSNQAIVTSQQRTPQRNGWWRTIATQPIKNHRAAIDFSNKFPIRTQIIYYVIKYKIEISNFHLITTTTSNPTSIFYF